MEIGSGQSPLSLAMMKTLGIASPARPATGAAGASPGPAKAAGPATASGDVSADLGVAKTLPRGSFIDLKV